MWNSDEIKIYALIEMTAVQQSLFVLFQMKVILRNKTSIESWIEEKVNVSLIPNQFVL